ncbi:crotonase/enoyl-CoA hydratase family protein [Dokdonella sp.]|uniref:crotonase/enoyl-CoA hydratase family protein n=1 Tax=Dokdonella sp. TaxID=2291710 RepID=UPI0026041146|nr:crotonase/enoyl-CoA hydratase family protein [Dokdonella sp.]
MTAVDFANRDTEFRLLDTHEDTSTGVHWCFMHKRSNLSLPGYRPCFSAQLLKELRQYQIQTAEAVRRPLRDVDSPLLHHLVLASEADVFNLGGDLDLFCRLIRAQDRASLLAYARQCIDVAYGFNHHLNDDFHTVALVQGDALGGGFEAALSCQTIIAEEGTGMGLPEVLFDLFPGMGAYSFLCRRVSPKLAEEMMMNGIVYSSEDLHRMGIVDILVPRGEGVRAVNEFVKRNLRICHARTAMNRVREICQPVTHTELTQVVEVWVDTALQLGEKALRTMERLVRAQQRRIPAGLVPTMELQRAVAM